MTCEKNSTTLASAIGVISEKGFDGMGEAIQLLINEAMRIERNQYLQAEPYERSPDRVDMANGYKSKTVKTRIGELALAVPQVRGCGFYPEALTKGLRSERALSIALAEMYVQGVATRRVKKVLESMCGFEVSSSEVSRAAKALDEKLHEWRNRPLGSYLYLILDARYEHVRQGESVKGSAVLIAFGIDGLGKRHVLGASVALSEAEVHWRSFLQSLIERGLHGLKLIVSDDHSGLKAARQAVLPSVPWQRCQFHLQQNAQAYVPKLEMRKAVAEDIRAVFNAPDQTEAKRLVDKYVNKYQATAPSLATWMQDNLEQGLTVMTLPPSHQRRLRTSNLAERINKEIKRRTRTVGIFPNPESCLRLVTALLMEIDDEWSEGIKYLTVN